MGVAAVLLAVGVLALTLFFSGGPPRAVSDRAAPSSADGRGDGQGDGHGAGQGAGATATAPATPEPVPTTGSGGRVDGVGVGGATPQPVVSTGTLGGGPLGTPAPGGPATLPGPTAPGVTIGLNPGVAVGVGWWLRSDAGRAHGRALGLLTKPGHGCQREGPGHGRGAAHARPAGCP
jgi:hypothetical protein